MIVYREMRAKTSVHRLTEVLDRLDGKLALARLASAAADARLAAAEAARAAAAERLAHQVELSAPEPEARRYFTPGEITAAQRRGR